jgi:hypothetical protein
MPDTDLQCPAVLVPDTLRRKVEGGIEVLFANVAGARPLGLYALANALQPLGLRTRELKSPDKKAV